MDLTGRARIQVERLNLDVPIFLQREREASGWGSLFLGAAFDPPRRSRVRLLDDLSFELEEGDRLAILGRNGAGKSTLLRVLNRVYQPTSGRVVVEGTCQALLNMSLGFNAEATVRENIFLRGIAMGLKASFLRTQVASILQFAGLEDKATHRLRTLSSGQKMRLGFAISTSIQNDIILMDEWIGAGDAEFMARAQERMKSRVGGSKILALASHSIGLLRSTCNRGIVLEKGRLVHAGDIVSALRYYHELLEQLRIQGVAEAEAVASGAQIYGCAETAEKLDDGRFRIKGWLVDTDGELPDGLAIEVRGARYAATVIERQGRKDVARHLGLVNEACGFTAIVAIPGLQDVDEFGEDVRVFGGPSAEDAYAPLRIAPDFRQRPKAPGRDGPARTRKQV